MQQIKCLIKQCKSKIGKTTVPEHCDLDTKEDGEHIQAEHNEVKIEKPDATLIEHNVGLDVKHTNDVIIKREFGDLIEYGDKNKLNNNMEDFNITLRENNKVFYNENEYNSSNNMHQDKCGPDKCRIRLNTSNNTALCSHINESNQESDGDCLADHSQAPEANLSSQLEPNMLSVEDSITDVKIKTEASEFVVVEIETLNMVNETETNHKTLDTTKHSIFGDFQIFGRQSEDFNMRRKSKRFTCTDIINYQCEVSLTKIDDKVVNNTPDAVLDNDLKMGCTQSLGGCGQKCATNNMISPKEFFCDNCNYKSNKRQYLVKHLKSHEIKKSFFCTLCQYSCRNKTDLVSHIRVHTGEKPFHCELCLYSGRSKSNLLKHMRVHTGEKPFSCSICQYSSTSNSNLASHMRIHSIEKPFQCTLCEYSSRYKSNLVNHIRIHTGETPYSCHLCEYACSNKGNLGSHIRTHSSEKPFFCHMCSYASKNKGDLLRHVRKHNSDKLTNSDMPKKSV